MRKSAILDILHLGMLSSFAVYLYLVSVSAHCAVPFIRPTQYWITILTSAAGMAVNAVPAENEIEGSISAHLSVSN